MKFPSIFIICIGFHVTYALAEDELLEMPENDLNFTIVNEILTKKFSDSEGNNYFHKADINFQICKSNVTEFLPFDPLLNHDGFCQYFKQKPFQECLKNYLIDLLPGLEINEMYIPYALLNAYNTGLGRLCGHLGYSNTEYIMNTLNIDHTSNDECVVKSLRMSLNFDKTCLLGLNIFKDLDRGVINLNKKDVCIDLVHLQSCLTQQTNKFCSGDYSRLFDLVFQPLIDECGYTKRFTFQLLRK